MHLQHPEFEIRLFTFGLAFTSFTWALMFGLCTGRCMFQRSRYNGNHQSNANFLVHNDSGRKTSGKIRFLPNNRQHHPTLPSRNPHKANCNHPNPLRCFSLLETYLSNVSTLQQANPQLQVALLRWATKTGYAAELKTRGAGSCCGTFAAVSRPDGTGGQVT